jgi:hypothetical protein
VIILNYNIKTENFLLELELEIFESDISVSPSNTILKLGVKSFGFSGDAEFDINIKDFVVFVENLQKIYNSLNGNAKLEEVYGTQYINFSADGKGHIFVTGFISQIILDYNQELKFSNEIDQTVLKEFVDKLSDIYTKYKK